MKKYKLKPSLIPAFFLLVILCLLLLSKLFPINKLDSLTETFLAAILVQILVFALPSFLFIRSRSEGYEYFSKLKLGLFKGKDIIFLIFFVLTISFGSILLNSLSFILGISDSDFTSSASYILKDVSTNTNFFYVLIAFAFIPAIFEEFLFRSILYSEYAKYNTVTALIISSLAYAMSHFSFPGFLSFFFVGLACSFAVYITNSIWSAVFIHFFFNLINIYFLPSLWNVITQPMGILFAIFVATALFLLFLLISLKQCEKRFLVLAKTVPEKPSDNGNKRFVLKCILSPMFLICITVFFLASVIIIIT